MIQQTRSFSVMAFRVHSPTASYVKRDRMCAHPHMNWLLPAWVLYLAGAAGYVVIDMFAIVEARISDTAINIGLMVLAVVYFVDSWCYLLAWLIPELERRDHENGGGAVIIDAAAWGEILYIFSAAFGVVSAGCLFLVPLDEGGQIRFVLSSIFALFAYGATLWISNTLYLVDACVYWSAWYNKRVTSGDKDNVMFDGYFWADGILLTIPSLIYFVTSTVLVFNLFTISVSFDTTGASYDIARMILQARNMIKVVRAFNILADFIYVADAFVYMIAWLADADTIKRLRIERGQDLPEIDLGQSFDIEPKEQ